MNGKKSTALFLLCAVLLLFVFTSCGTDADENEKTNNGETNKNNNTANGSAAEETTAPEFQPLKDAGYDGYEFRILGAGTSPVIWDYAAASSINETAAETETGEPINDTVFRRNRDVEELYNIIITPLYPGDTRSAIEQYILKMFMSGEDTYDAAFVLGSSATKTILASNQYTYDLFDVGNLNLSASWWDKQSVADLSVAKQLHMVTGDISIFSALSVDHLFLNKNMAELYELDNAYDVVRQGKWTWDVLTEMSRKVSRDLNGDGVLTIEDQFGICCETSNMRQIVISSGARISSKDADDLPVLTVNTENTVTVFDYALQSFLNKDISILANEYAGKYKDIWNDMLLPKFRNDEFLFIALPLLYALDFRNMESDFGILPYPKLSEHQSEYYTLVGRYFSTYIYIPTTCPDSGRSGAVIDALGYYSQKYVKPAVIDVTVTNKLIRDNDSADMVNLLLDTRVFDLALLYNWENLTDTLLYPVAQTRSNGFASNYAKNEEKIKAAIQKTISEMQGQE